MPRMISSGVILIGLRGCGKTSLGQALADLLSFAFFDLDFLLARRHDKPAGQLLQEIGETAFRREERDLIERLVLTLRERNAVLALGGGSLESPEVERVLGELRENNGYVAVWLDVPIAELTRRIEAQEAQAEIERPRLAGRSLAEELRLLLARRVAGYKRNTELRFRNESGDPLERAVALAEQLASPPHGLLAPASPRTPTGPGTQLKGSPQEHD